MHANGYPKCTQSLKQIDSQKKMKNSSGFTFRHFLLIVMIFTFLISCNKDDIILDNYNIVGKWKYIDVSDSIDYYEHLLIFESDSTFEYKFTKFKSILPINTPDQNYGLNTTFTYTGKFLIDDNNLIMNADTIYFPTGQPFLLWVFKVDVTFYDECNFSVVDTVLTLNYTTYKANKPIANRRSFIKYEEQD